MIRINRQFFSQRCFLSSDRSHLKFFRSLIIAHIFLLSENLFCYLILHSLISIDYVWNWLYHCWIWRLNWKLLKQFSEFDSNSSKIKLRIEVHQTSKYQTRQQRVSEMNWATLISRMTDVENEHQKATLMRNSKFSYRLAFEMWVFRTWNRLSMFDWLVLKNQTTQSQHDSQFLLTYCALWHCICSTHVRNSSWE